MDKIALCFFCILILQGISACQKEELAVLPYDRGSITTQKIAMGADYSQQIWFDLGSNSIIKTSHKTAWDLAFDCSDSSHFLYLNTARVMRAAKLDISNFDSLVQPQSLSFLADHPSGNTDSLALGYWWNYGFLYVIDLGYDEQGNALGYRKLKAELLANGACSLTFAQLDGTGLQTLVAEKDSLYNTVAFSLLQTKVLQIEPAKDQYDLFFTGYTHIFYAPYTPYSVTGVLLNSWHTQAAEDFVQDFSDINAAFLPDYTFQDSSDKIGYDWKTFDFQNNTYQTNPTMNFIIRDAAGFYYKLHFVDFYNESGIKGFPTFEFILI